MSYEYRHERLSLGDLSVQSPVPGEPKRTLQGAARLSFMQEMDALEPIERVCHAKAIVNGKEGVWGLLFCGKDAPLWFLFGFLIDPDAVDVPLLCCNALP